MAKRARDEEEVLTPATTAAQSISISQVPSPTGGPISNEEPLKPTSTPAPAAAVVVVEEEPEDDIHEAKASQTLSRHETKALLDTFDDTTLERYEVFRRAHLPKSVMRKQVSLLIGPVPTSVAIVVSGVAKIFVGEMVEGALEVMDERKETGSVTPGALREAFRRYKKRTGTMTTKLYKHRLF